MEDQADKMTFNDVLRKLNIEDYAQRIYHSNSHGELSHLDQYYVLASAIGGDWFREWFVEVVKYAEENWQRPQSVYQHITTILEQTVEAKPTQENN